MIIKQTLGNIRQYENSNKVIDYLFIEWHETNKRVLHKYSESGKEFITRFLNGHQELSDGDIIYDDNQSLVVINILPCESLMIQPRDSLEIASACYEIGNKHLPLFFQEGKLLVPFEEPLFKLLVAGGYDVIKARNKLTTPLRSTVAPHSQAGGSLFSKILKITTATSE